ncbi:MAG: glycoside hydrolase family 2 [Prevotellaceae bacterium]|nr:glycoside hydrolase family 2 [Prevotellaceae bacterium]
MRNIFFISAVILPLCVCCGDRSERDFATPPETVTTGVYWYWVNDNISKDGVVRDLQAMKQAGINSAYIGNIGGQPVQSGDVKLMTGEWMEILHTAMKTAGELGIEIGMFNCPGWSHSGGPWIKPEQSMRHLVASETLIRGGSQPSSAGRFKLAVPSKPTQYKDWSREFADYGAVPSPDFQDVRTLAIPVPDDYRYNLFDEKEAKIVADNMRPLEGASLDRPVHGVSPESPLYIRHVAPKGHESSVTLRLPHPCDARSLTIYTSSYCKGEGELQARTGGQFVTVAKYPLYRINPIPTVGFTPFAPSVVGFDRVTSDEYRIVFRNMEHNAAIGKIVLSPTAALDKYPEKSLARMFQRSNPAWTEHKWTTATDVPAGNVTETAIDPATVIDLTDKLQPDGTLVWDAPEGNWLVLRMGMVPNEVFNTPAAPEGKGLEMDKLNPAFIQHQFDSFLGKALESIPAKDRSTFRVAIMDSWEKGAQTFTDNFIDSLKARYGYDPVPFLPVLTGHLVGSPEQADRFLWDVRRLAAEMIASNLLPGFNAVAHKHGLETWVENYGGWGFPAEPLIFGKYADRVGGEFWTGGNMHYIDVAASCAHVYNKPRVYAEAFTSRNTYQHHPATIKRDGDAAFAAGMTACVLHVYIEQAYENKYPGTESWFGVEFNRKNIWFQQMDLFTAYLKRCGFMLEQGLNVADVAYFLGEDVPVNSGPLGLTPDAVKDSVTVHEMPDGYHFDYVNSDIIINSMTVKDGMIVLPHGTSYRLLVLPPFKTMRPEVLRSIERLVGEGAAVLGEAPQRSPSLQNLPQADKDIAAIAAKMWGDRQPGQRAYGKGVVFSGMTIADALAALRLAPDMETGENLAFAHRTTPDREIYFVASRSDSLIRTAPKFRVSGKSKVELWNPVTGERRNLSAREHGDGFTTVPLQFEPSESMFIVFSGKGKLQSKADDDNFPAPTTLLELASPWTVIFESDTVRRGPADPVVFDKLESWSLNADERIRYFSGKAVYSNTFNLAKKPRNSDICIDLGKVGVMAKVKVNGKYAGGVWTYPYRVNISRQVKTGDNTVEIEVVNTWNNRFIGESSLPKEKRIVHPRNNRWNPASPLSDAGLLMPAKIVAIKR